MWNLIWQPWISLGKEELCTCKEYKECWICTHSHNIEEFREFKIIHRKMWQNYLNKK